MSEPIVKKWIILSICILFFLLIPGINHGLWKPDEPRVAGTCAEMARTGDFMVPHLNGKPFLEKPPLYYAAAAVSGSLLGIEKDVPYRLVSLLFAFLTILGTYAVASRREGAVTGLVAAGLLASSWEFFMLSRWIQVDISLVFGVTLAMYAYLRVTDSFRTMDLIMLGFAVGITFMAKGLVGPVIIAAAVMTDMIRRKDFRIAWRMKPHLILMSMFVIILPWIIGLWSRGGWPFIREVIVVNNLMRFTGAPEGAALGHQHGPLYYLQHFPTGFLPWTLIFLPAIVSSMRKFRDDPYVSWFIGPFILLLVASTKRGIYLVPLFPAAACITACWLTRASRVKWENVMVKITWGFAIAACFVPFTGIFFGMPVLGVCMGIIAVSGLMLFTGRRMEQHEAVSLVAVACIALSAVTMIYYPYAKHDRDYLQFAKQAITVTGDKDITILSDESLAGVFPLLTGKNVNEVLSPSDIKTNGVYVWADKDDRVLNSLKRRAEVRILFEKKMNFSGRKTARVASIVIGTETVSEKESGNPTSSTLRVDPSDRDMMYEAILYRLGNGIGSDFDALSACRG